MVVMVVYADDINLTEENNKKISKTKLYLKIHL